MNGHYDLIIIGTGAGGGTLLNRLAPSGKKILVLERGPWLPREKDNWSYKGSFNYYSKEAMFDRDGNAIYPGMCYHVGGNTKVYGAALFRLREKDFESYRHKDGLSPEWPLKYRDFEPYYTEAEELYQVHGKAGEDPTEPWRSKDYPHPAMSHEPRIQEVFDTLRGKGIKAYPAPMGIRINEAEKYRSACIRCDTCDGYPCLLHAKSDSEISAIRPVMDRSNVTIATGCKVLRLHTSASGREINAVEAEIDGARVGFSADIVVVACGSVNSAALLLRSANDRHPRGIANSSDQVGRNLMKHVLGSLVGVSSIKPNPSRFQKTMAVNDFYWGEPGYEFPMGNVQLMGKTTLESLLGHEARYAPLTIQEVAANSIDWWLTTEDLPDPNNRVKVAGEGGEKIVIDYTENNAEPFDRLVARWTEILKSIGCGCHILPQASYFSMHSGYWSTKMPMHSIGHQVGTCKFGEDSKSSALDLNCKAHDLDNLYVVDGSFFISSGAVNPTLTIVANALRVGDHLLQRLGAMSSESATLPRAGGKFSNPVAPEVALA